MRLRVFSALPAALLCTYWTVADAMVVPEAAGGIPSSFGYAVDQDTTGVVSNPATARLIEAARIFSRRPVPERSFEHDASRGITYPATDLKAPSLEELIVIASVDPSRYVKQDGRPSQSGSTETFLDVEPDSERARGKVRDLAKALLNRGAPLPQDDGPAGQDSRRSHGTGGYKYLDALLDAELDRELVSTVTEIVSPSVTPEGIVALNFLGARDFAFLTSPVTNKIQVVDFGTGMTLTVSHSTDTQPSVASPALNRPQQERQVRTGSKPLLVRLITKAREIAVHPLTYLSLILVTAFGFFFRLLRGAAA